MKRDELLIIFDCDGTLVDSEGLAHQLFVDFLQTKGVDADPKEFAQNIFGKSMQESLDILSEKYQIQFANDFVDNYRRELSMHYSNSLCPFPGILNVLGRSPYKICVASNGPQVMIQHALKTCQLSSYFLPQTIFSAYDIQKWKPDPDLFLFAAKSLGHTPENCIVIEDSDTGLIASNRAGMTTYFFNPARRQTNVPVDKEIYNYKNLLTIIESEF